MDGIEKSASNANRFTFINCVFSEAYPLDTSLCSIGLGCIPNAMTDSLIFHAVLGMADSHSIAFIPFFSLHRSDACLSKDRIDLSHSNLFIQHWIFKVAFIEAFNDWGSLLGVNPRLSLKVAALISSSLHKFSGL
jgi:hypothetical protein